MDETESMEKNNKDRFEGLLAKGKEQGFVSEDDILAAVPEPEADIEEIEEEGIEVAPEIDEHDIVDDSVRMYLREIGRVPLLTWEGEKHLAMQMEEGKLLEEIRDYLERRLGREALPVEIVVEI